ncbi:hypothetical protein GCM10020256_51570 [Streptomyces thermocoprophilus]|jgi:hypothetical protein
MNTGSFLCSARLMGYGPIQQWARVGAARAERAEGRAMPGVEPGLDEVEKPATAPAGMALGAAPACVVVWVGGQ